MKADMEMRMRFGPTNQVVVDCRNAECSIGGRGLEAFSRASREALLPEGGWQHSTEISSHRAQEKTWTTPTLSSSTVA